MQKIRKYFFSLFTVTLVSFGIFLAIIFNIDPDAADIITIAALFAAIFLSISGLLTLIIFYLRVRLSNWEVVFAQLPIAARHATMIALAMTGLLLLRMLRVLGWWEAILYILIITLLEFYFRSRPKIGETNE